MFATFVIGLREGLEAALIVGIVAAFLRRSGRSEVMRSMWAGIALAITLCVAAGIGLQVLSAELPQRQQEGLETVIGAVAVVMVTYMIVWMKNHSRSLKGDLESAASSALSEGSSRAFVVMAFLAVLREGLETAVFLLAAVNASDSGLDALAGALLGIAVAVVLGYGIYRGGVRLNLSKFFRATGFVLALVAAGLVMMALRTAHEAGWLQWGQQQTIDLTWLVRPGTLRSSLLTGVLGIQQHPVAIELAGWLLYVVPVATIVVWPPGRRVSRSAGTRLAALVAAGLVAVAAVMVVTAPDAPATATPAGSGASTVSRGTAGTQLGVAAPTADGTVAASLSGVGARTATLTLGGAQPSTVRLTRRGTHAQDGVDLLEYTATSTGGISAAQAGDGAPTSVGLARLAAAAGGRLPLGVNQQNVGSAARLTYARSVTTTVLVDPDSHRLVSFTHDTRVTAAATTTSGTAVSLGVVTAARTATSATAARAALASAAHFAHESRRHAWLQIRWPVLLALGAVAAAGVAAALTLTSRPRPRAGRPHTGEVPA